jgi:hypothetical protein
MDDHMSFLASELLGLSWSVEVETCVYVDVLWFEEFMVASGSSVQEVRAFRRF